MIVAEWKIRKIAFRLAAPQREAAKEMEQNAADIVRGWALNYVPSEVRLMCAKYPKMSETINLAFKKADAGRSYSSITLEKFPCGDIFLNGVADLDQTVAPLAKCRKWQESVKDVSELESSLRCAMHKINTYAKFKMEFPEAYEALLILDKESGQDPKLCPCDAIESVRAKLIKDAPDTKLIDAKTIR